MNKTVELDPNALKIIAIRYAGCLHDQEGSGFLRAGLLDGRHPGRVVGIRSGHAVEAQ